MKNKVIAVLVCFCVLCTTLGQITGFAKEGTTFLLDTSNSADIIKCGFEAENKNVKETSYSAKWNTDETKEFRMKDTPKDISNHSIINFSLYLESNTEESAQLMFYIGSENNKTDGLDYYSREIKLQPGKWKTFSVNYAELDINREPLGFDKVDEIRLTATGWSNKVAPGSVIYVENVYLSGEPTTITGATESQTQTPADVFNENAAVGDMIHYNFGGFEGEDIKIGGYAKTNKFAIEKDKKSDNHYLRCEILDSTSDCHWDLSINSPTRYMVFDFDVSTSQTMPNGAMQFKDVNGVNAGELISYGENTINLGDGKEVKIKKGKWTNIAVVCDFLKNTKDVYVDGVKKVENCKFSNSVSISLVRFYFLPNNAVGTNMLFDNYKVYEGICPRNVENNEVANKKPLINTDNTKAENLLKDTVALAVGGNGIYYNGEKHDLDAPAYVDNYRTLIPVRAVSEAFGLDVSYDAETKSAIIDKKAKIVIDSAEMTLPDGSLYTLDVPAKVTNNRTFIPLRALCEKILQKTVTWHEKGIIIVADKEIAISDIDADVINNYLLYDRPDREEIIGLFNENNKNSHPRIMMDKQKYNEVIYKYQNDSDVREWGNRVIENANEDMLKSLPKYTIPDTVELLVTSRDVYSRAQNLSMAYILTKDKKYADCLYEVYEAAGDFQDWNPKHFLDVAEMSAAFAIGYDWLYDCWSEEQKSFLENAIYKHGVSALHETQYGNLPESNFGMGNITNWNVVCNGGCIMGAVAIFDKYPEECADMIVLSVRDTEAMMESFYPDGAWDEGIGYWEYTLAYTVNMFSTLEACFNTDFNLSKAPGFSNTINFYMAGDGSVGINNFHDCEVLHGSTNTYFWLSNKFNMPAVTNVRLCQIEEKTVEPTAFDMLWYDTSIKGKEFELSKDMYLRGVEMVSMRESWTDENGAWLSYHGGTSVANHSHLDTGTFVFELAGVRWATDLGPDNYYLPDYFTNGKHKYYRLRPEGHNVYVIDPSDKEGQTLNHFAQVETLVSKPRGAYSVLDMTEAYSPWVKNAKRGYMLTDDRRSAVIRDEIEFNTQGREIYWFMNVPSGAKIDIQDKNTAYITSEGVVLKFMIDSDISNYEFEVTDARPLEDSPNPAGQATNRGRKKLCLKGTASDKNYIECKMILANDPNANNALDKKSIANWQIPDGECEKLPVLDMISVNGEELSEFEPTKIAYSRTINYDDTSSVVVTAKASEEFETSILYGDTYKDSVKIKVFRKDNPNVYRIYTYNTEIIPRLGDILEYDRLNVVSHSASAEPEKEHGAENVSDNNTDPESRWAAEGDVWLTLDLGEEKEIDAVGVSAWKGGERAYTFKIEISSDGNNWSEVVAERETNTVYAETIGIYDFECGAVKARYVRYCGKGNTVNDWNSLMEIAALRKKN